MTRVERLQYAYRDRRDLDVRAEKAPEGAELVRVSWTQQTLSAKGNSEDRRIVRWFGFVGTEPVDSGARKASVIEMLEHHLALVSS